MTDDWNHDMSAAPKGEAGRYASGPYLLGCAYSKHWVVHAIVRWEYHQNGKTGSWKANGRVFEPDCWMHLPAPPIAARNGEDA